MTGLLLAGCETDFDTTAPYRDITVVYGLINPNDSMQYIKVNKAFLTDDNVLTYAADPDSSQYNPPLQVWVEEWTRTGDSVRAWPFDTTTVYNKEPGQFYFPEQVIYKWQKPEFPYSVKYIIEGLNDTVGVEYFWLNPDNIYRLKIKNPQTGKIIEAESELVEDYTITQPGFASFIRFVPDPVNPRPFTWEQPGNAGRYDVEIRFNYRELFFSSSDTLDKYIVLLKQSVQADPNSSEMSIYYWDDSFFSACYNLIPYSDPSVEAQVKDRFTGTIEVIVDAAETQLALYMEVYEPSTSIVQEKPDFSNITNGIGIFSSRARKTKTKRLHTETVAELQATDDNIYKFRY
ncbi:MAG: hypothetical protein Kow00127_18520 [Bacteroidales bacterium]